MRHQPWVTVYECVTSPMQGQEGYRAPRTTVPFGATLRAGESLSVGREGDLPIGAEIYDVGISRQAATVTATATGWRLEVTNSNGAVVHPWGQAPTFMKRPSSTTLTWPRVAIQVLNGVRQGSGSYQQHWILLESDSLEVTRSGPSGSSGTMTSTFIPKRPEPLTAAQLDALRLVFADHLRWPPPLPARPALLASVARKLGIGENGVRERLNRAQARALQFGLPRVVGVTEPDYLYVLVRAGYIEPPTSKLYRRELR